MQRALMASGFLGLLVLGGAGGVACSSSSNGAAGGGTTADAAAGDAGNPFAVVLPCTDSIASVYADPGDVSGQAQGAILKCAFDQEISQAALEAAARATSGASDAGDGGSGGDPGYSGKPFTSGARIYRVLFRTERGDPNNTPGYSSSLVLIPDTPRAAHVPVVVASHGSRGQAGQCAGSEEAPAASDVNPDLIHQIYPLVGLGYAVIAPDLAGYANYGGANNPPSAYGDVLDVGKSTLDGARALRKLIPNALTPQVALVGHSQGGNTTFSALSIADSYGAGGTIAAVAVYSPLWFSQRALGALFLEPSTYPFTKSSAGVVSIWYHYTHSELLDGAGHGTDLFQPSKQAGIKSFVDNDCWAGSYPDLEALGNSVNDVFLTSYQNSIEFAAGTSGECNGDATCQTWLGRMTADFPHLQGTAASVPVMVAYGNDDTTITPDLMACVFRRLSEDKANYKTCYDTDPVGHSGIVTAKADYVADWLAQQTLGGPAPTETCSTLSADDAGVPQVPGFDGGVIPCNPLVSEN